MISDTQYLNWQKKISENFWFRWFCVFCGSFLVLALPVISLYIYLVYGNWKITVWVIVTGLFTRYVACELIHKFYKKAHPYQRLNFKPQTSWLFSLADSRKDAFPSEHASTVVAICTVFIFFYPALGLWAFAAAIFISFGRIMLGFHDIYDVMCGWVLGFVCGLLAIYLSTRIW